jgi:cytosine/adenosine deaminase-related metal-dependent hydrolase
MRIRIAISLLLAFFCCDLSALDTASAIRFGRLVDGQGKTWTNAVVLVRDGRIEKVLTSDATIPPDAKVIDLHQYTGLPGPIDVHTHMTLWWNPIPDDVLAEMVKRGTFYVPTIDHNRYYVDAREEFKCDDKVVAGLNAYIQKTWKQPGARTRPA